MKNLLLILVLLPVTASASDRFNSARWFPAVGGGLLDESGYTANTCVEGTKVDTTLPKPEVSYRLYTSKNSSGSYSLKAEMNVVIKRTDLSFQQAGLKTKLSAQRFKEVCGEKYVSADLIGARQTFGMQLEAGEEFKVPTLELTEFDGVSRASQFADLVTTVVEKALGREASWPMSESAGPIGQANGFDIGTSFNSYRDLAISSPDKILVIQGESAVYSPSLLQEMVK